MGKRGPEWDSGILRSLVLAGGDRETQLWQILPCPSQLSQPENNNAATEVGISSDQPPHREEPVPFVGLKQTSGCTSLRIYRESPTTTTNAQF